MSVDDELKGAGWRALCSPHLPGTVTLRICARGALRSGPPSVRDVRATVRRGTNSFRPRDLRGAERSTAGWGAHRRR